MTASADELKSRREALRNELSAVERELDTHRVKCPTCRCRLLPGEGCECCAESAEDVGDLP